MSEAAANQAPGTPAPQPQELVLGSRDAIRLIGLYRDKRSDSGLLLAWCYDGMLEDDQPHKVPFRTKTADKEVAKVRVEIFLNNLRTQWDAKKAAGHKTGGTQPAPANGSMDAHLLRLDKEWSSLNGSRLQTHRGYITENRAFRRIAGSLCQRDPGDFTEGECIEIRDTRLPEVENSADQSMANLRVVLGLVPGFPSALVDLFRPASGQRPDKKDQSFGPSDLRLMNSSIGGEDRDTQGEFYLGFNLALQPVDIAWTLWATLRAMRDKIIDAKRLKTKRRFRGTAWEELARWIDKNDNDPKAVYAFAGFVFNKKELKDPTINHRRLPKEEEQERRVQVSRNASKHFDRYLEKLGIKRPGISLTSIRHTVVTIAEANNVPRKVGMDLTSHRKEENYVDYASVTAEQRKSLSELIRDTLRFPGRRVFICLTQVANFVAKNIIRSEIRIRRQIRASAGETRAEIESLRREVSLLRAALGNRPVVPLNGNVLEHNGGRVDTHSREMFPAGRVNMDETPSEGDDEIHAN